MNEFAEKIQETIDKTIADIFTKTTADDGQFTSIERRFKLIDLQLATLKRLNLNMDEIMRQMNHGESQTKFLSKTLPLFTHISVCEAIEKVVG